MALGAALGMLSYDSLRTHVAAVRSGENAASIVVPGVRERQRNEQPAAFAPPIGQCPRGRHVRAGAFGCGQSSRRRRRPASVIVQAKPLALPVTTDAADPAALEDADEEAEPEREQVLDAAPPTMAASPSTRVPWSTVYLGHRALGTTPLANVPVPRGPQAHALFDRDGRQHMRRIPRSESPEAERHASTSRSAAQLRVDPRARREPAKQKPIPRREWALRLRLRPQGPLRSTSEL